MKEDFNTKQKCIDELVKIQFANPDKAITRDFFRARSDCNEWISHFGQFAEFRRAAGLIPTRRAQKHLNEIAEHASRDELKQFNVERADYAGRYIKDVRRRWKYALVCSDLHDYDCDSFFLRTFIDSVKRIRPDYIVLNGDILDCPEFSRYLHDPRLYDPVGRLEWLGKFLKKLREASPDSRIDFLSGNHEERFLRHLKEASPATIDILDKIHGMTISKLFNLDKYEINYIAFSDLSISNKHDADRELEKNFLILDEQLLFNHFPRAKKSGMPCIWGHHHKFIVEPLWNVTFGVYNCLQLAAGCKREASYTPSAYQWQTGFAVIHMDTHKKKNTFELVDCTYESCHVGGKRYERNEDELKEMLK